MDMPAVRQRIDLAVDSKCNGLPAAQKDWGPTDWASLARFEMRCGDRQRGSATQARIYAGAVGAIEYILYLMPDAYGSGGVEKDCPRSLSPEGSLRPHKTVNSLRCFNRWPSR